MKSNPDLRLFIDNELAKLEMSGRNGIAYLVVQHPSKNLHRSLC